MPHIPALARVLRASTNPSATNPFAFAGILSRALHKVPESGF